MFHLVQRLELRPQQGRDARYFAASPSAGPRFDAVFACDYMGSSEFEYGLGGAYRRMLNYNLSLRSVELTRNNVTRPVYFIATDEADAYGHIFHGELGSITSFEQLLAAFRLWFEQPCLRAKEVTYFDMLFDGNIPEYRREYPPKVIAWWSLDDNVVWTLDETVARELLRTLSLNPLPATR